MPAPGSRSLQEARLEDPAHSPGTPGGRCSGLQVAEPEGSGKEGARTVLARLLSGGLGFRVTLQPAALRDSA